MKRKSDGPFLLTQDLKQGYLRRKYKRLQISFKVFWPQYTFCPIKVAFRQQPNVIPFEIKIVWQFYYKILQNTERNILYLWINVPKMYNTLTQSCMYVVENNCQRYLLTFTSPGELQAVILHDVCCFLPRWNPFLPNDHNSGNHRVMWEDHLLHQAIPPTRFTFPMSLLVSPFTPFFFVSLPSFGRSRSSYRGDYWNAHPWSRCLCCLENQLQDPLL